MPHLNTWLKIYDTSGYRESLQGISGSGLSWKFGTSQPRYEFVVILACSLNVSDSIMLHVIPPFIAKHLTVTTKFRLHTSAQAHYSISNVCMIMFQIHDSNRLIANWSHYCRWNEFCFDRQYSGNAIIEESPEKKTRNQSNNTRPRMEKSHSKRHELLVCWIVGILMVLNVQQTRLCLHYWYK